MKLIKNIFIAIIKILILPIIIVIGGGPFVIKSDGNKPNPLFKATLLVMWLVVICNFIYKMI